MKRGYSVLTWTLGGALLVVGVLVASRIAPEAGSLAQSAAIAHVKVDSTQRFQTITGWEVTAQAGQEEVASYQLLRDSLLNLAVNDLGITRVRLWLRSGYENNRDVWQDVRSGKQREFRCSRFTTQNDNDDPRRINPAGFHFSQLDNTMEQLVLPLKRRLEARGEKLFINANYVAFMRQCPPGSPYHHTTAEEYAEFVLASYLHLRDKFGIIPDAWEVILEPENTDHWRGRQIGEAIVASARRLKEHGFAPHFIAPSNTKAANAVRYFDEMIKVPGVLAYLDELSYHRYRGVTVGAISALGERGQRYGVNTAMLEHIGSGYDDLHQDLKVGRISAWQQFTLAYPVKKDDGAQYYIIKRADSRKPGIRLAERTRYLRQYFRYVRPGAVRVAASSDVEAVDPLAFAGPQDRFAVVIKTSDAARISVSGLRRGRYEARYTTRRQTDIALKTMDGTSGAITLDMPAAGVLTLSRIRAPQPAR